MPIIPTTRPKSPYSKVSNPVSRLLKKVKGEPEDETMLVDMKNDGCYGRRSMPPSLIELHRRSTYGVLQSSEAVLLEATSIAPRPMKA
jgi:hypothetical protein